MSTPPHADVISLREFRVDCIVGVYPEERHKVQPLTVELDLVLDTEPAARSERLQRTADYHAISTEIIFLLQNAHFTLLETAAHALALYLLAPPAPGERRATLGEVRLKLTKPGALRGNALPAVEIRRDASWPSLEQEQKPFGTVDIIHETKAVGIYRLNVAPGKSIPLHAHYVMRECEMVLSDGVLCQEKAAPKGTVFRWPHGTPHRYDNPSNSWQTILCIDSPPFMEADEKPIQTESAPKT